MISAARPNAGASPLAAAFHAALGAPPPPGAVAFLASIAADYAQLAAALRTWRTRYPDQEHLSLRPADAIAYDRILRTMDVALSARYATLGFAG